MLKKWWKNPETKKQVIAKISKSVKASLKEKYSWDRVFLNKYYINKNGCFIYLGSLNSEGYGRTSFKGKVVGSHRLSYELKKGKLNDSKIFVCHSCDNPSCINPEHLWLGTHSENMIDMMKKNRGSISTLSQDQREQIKKTYPTKNMIELSVFYKVPTRVISFIINNA